VHFARHEAAGLQEWTTNTRLSLMLFVEGSEPVALRDRGRHLPFIRAQYLAVCMTNTWGTMNDQRAFSTKCGVRSSAADETAVRLC
jgi:hypothetical protein